MAEDKDIRIFHLSDTHLGFSAYRKVDQNGINQREKDIYASFTAVVDYIIKEKPDMVIHAGDLFDSVRPTNRAIGVAVEQLLRLSRASIPTVLISGNHETPKLRETGHIFRLFEHLENIYPVYDDGCRTNYFDIKNRRIAVHAVPHCREQKIFSRALREVEPDDSADYNILVTHGAIQSIREFRMNEFNEYIIPLSFIENKFDYVALGHYHRYVHVQDNIVYSGSTERLSFSEAKDEKGIVELNLSEKPIVSFRSFPVRPMIDTEPVDCGGLSIKEINNNIKKISESIRSDGAIVRITLLNLEQSIYQSLDFSFIKSLFNNCLHLEIRHTATSNLEDSLLSKAPAIGDLSSEFKRFVENLSHGRKEILLKLGVDYIRRAYEGGR